ncbi:MAG: translocation/assembly module TamB domain-containing protein [Elusimicrobia bacterium]|nr:translocation/assembly module TamB domain-containing protein [Elusimicrobiota bacterium]
MKRRVQLFILLFIAGLVFFSTQTIRIRFAEQPVRAFLEHYTKLPVSYSAIAYQFPFRFKLTDIVIGDSVSCHGITIRINPFSYLLPRILHSSLMTHIDCDEPLVTYSPEFKRLLATLTEKPQTSAPRYEIAWTKASLLKDELRVQSPSGFVRRDGLVSGNIIIAMLGHVIDTNFSANPAENGSTAVKATIAVSGSAVSGSGMMNGRYSAAGAVAMSINIKSANVGKYAIKNGIFTLSIDGDDIHAGLRAPGIQLAFDNSGKTGALSSQIDFSSILKNATGTCIFDIQKSSAGITGTVHTRDAYLPSILCGNSDVYFARTSSGSFTARGLLSPAAYTMKTRYDPANGLLVILGNKKGGTATFSGTIFPLKISADISDWDLTDNPVTTSLYPGLTGTVSVRGIFSSAHSIAHLTAKQWQIPGARPQSFTADCQSYNGNWFYSLDTSRKDIRVRGTLLTDGFTTAKSSFNGFPISDILPWLKSTIPITGTINGSAEYSSRGYGSAVVTGSDTRWGSVLAGGTAIDVRWNPEQCDIRDISLKTSSGSVIVSGLIPLNLESKSPSLFVSFHQFAVPHLRIDGRLSFTGGIDIIRRDFSGLITGAKIHVNDQIFQSVRIPFRVGRVRIEIIDAAIDAIAKGTFFFDRIKRQVGGTAAYANFPASIVLPDVKGKASGTIGIDGPALKPHIVLNGNINNGWYKSLPFTATGALHYLNNTVLTDTIKFTSGSGQLVVSGKLWPQTYASVRATSIPLYAIAAVTGSGTAQIHNKSGLINGHGTITSKGLYINEAVARIADSELRFSKGSALLFDSRSFEIFTELRNVHAAGTDIFGKVKAKGTWDVTSTHADVSAVCTGSNLWINQLMVPNLTLPLHIRDSVIQFRPDKKQIVKVSGTIDLADRSRIACNKLSVSSGEQSVIINGSVGDGSINMRIKGTAVDGTILSELANLPVIVTGKVFFEYTAKGEIEQPDMEGSVSINKGLINELAFDSLSAKIFVQHDVLTFERARLEKSHQFTVSATGLMPFSMTEAGRKRTTKQPMNLSVNLENGDMSVLSSLTQDIASAKGSVSSQLRITGTPSKPVFDGFIKMTDGSVYEKRYFGQLKDIAVDINMKNSLVTINNFRARSGSGTMRLKGTVALSGMSPDMYALSLYTEGDRGIPLVIPELPIPTPLIKNDDWRVFSNLSHTVPTFSVQLKGPAARPMLSGWVELENTRFTYPSIIKPTSEREGGDFQSRLLLDLELRAGKNIWYDNELASVNIRGGIRLTGPYMSPLVAGTIEAVHGTISYFGTEFEITHASIELLKKTAFIEGEATTEVYGSTASENDTIVMVVDKSDLANVKPRFISRLNAMLPSEKALGKATNTNPDSFSNPDQDYAMRQQLLRLFDTTLTTPLARSILRRSGIADSFKVQYLNQLPIKPVQSGSPTMAELLYGTKYSMGKNLTNQLLLGYSVIFDEFNNKLDLRHELEMSYKLQKNTLLKGVYELDTHNPFRQYDKRITLEQQWRFNLFGSQSGKKTKHTETPAAGNSDTLPVK